MTEEEARAWIRARWGVSRETQLTNFVALLEAESTRQNLISASTLPEVWARHVVDSAQLLPLASESVARGPWLDVGTGAGFPGVVVAILSEGPVHLVEPRARRAEFLASAIARLGLEARVEVHATRVETYRPAGPAAVISARAVADLSRLIASAAHCASQETVWLLPKGRRAQSEVAAAQIAWQGLFHVKPSVTQADSGIVIARGVSPK